MEPEALCYRVVLRYVRPYVHACVRDRTGAFSDRLAVDFYTVRQKKNSFLCASFLILERNW